VDSPSKRAEPSIRLPEDEIRALHRRAAEAGEEEACGILVGTFLEDGGCRVHRSVAASNVWPGDRRRRYEISPHLLLEVMKSARGEGHEIVGYYHSHPRGPARPSIFDASCAWPEVSYVIVTPGAEPELASWRFDVGGEAVEQPVIVER
jgi:proteasome lid subunit RPN8/RPN11